MENTLHSQTIAGLQMAKGQLGYIALEAGVDYSWLTKFSRGVFPDPSVRRVERVYRALAVRGLVEESINFGSQPPLKDCA